MRVALAHDWVFHRRGGEAVWEEVRALLPDAELLALFADERNWPAEWRGLRLRTSVLNRLPGVRHYYRALLPLFPLAVRTLRSDADLTVSISHCAIKNLPVAGRHLCYCLTPARYLYDLRAAYLASLPAWTRPAADSILDRLAVWDRAGAARVTRFAAISRTVAERIRACYGREATVVHPPVDTEYFTPGGAPPSDYYLAVSALVPYKRLDIAIAACRQVRRKLVVVGDGSCARQWLDGSGGEVVWKRQVSRAELRELYRGCRALLFPAHEDFGIVPVEAMACGRPVIALAHGGAAETVRHGASGLLCAEQQAAAFAAALAESERRDWDPAACRAAALPYARERFVAAFAALLREMTQGAR